MEISNSGIDGGRPFDWGRTSEDYARFRDIYPEEFYKRILQRGLCVEGQNVLDIGTGTGVLPRAMHKYGARFTGADISEQQIEYAKELCRLQGIDNIDFIASPAEELSYPPETFDVVTACQCIWYFDHERLMPSLARMLKPGGRMLILYLAWLPFEDEIAQRSEQLVLKYNPDWTGGGETRHPVFVPECAERYFDVVYREQYDIKIPFTRESWNGRMKACRGVGASMPPEVEALWEAEHIKMLESTAGERFEVLHYAATAELVKKPCLEAGM